MTRREAVYPNETGRTAQEDGVCEQASRVAFAAGREPAHCDENRACHPGDSASLTWDVTGVVTQQKESQKAQAGLGTWLGAQRSGAGIHPWSGWRGCVMAVTSR